MVKKKSNKTINLILLLAILITTTLVYLNHFDNPFFFDDTHTITENESIKSIENWTGFFTNPDTFSSLPANRSYRPVITFMNALDYKIGNGLNPNFFHYHIFFWFLFLIILVFFLSKNIYESSIYPSYWVTKIALFSSAWFALHTVNAETINYICARSDSFSSFCIVASLLLYINPFAKKWYLYLITAIIGVLTKQTGVMFLPILVTYILLFEEYSLIENPRKNTKNKLIRLIKKISPTVIIIIPLFLFNQYYLTPESTVSTNYTITRFEYISTQCFVIIHYLSNFILPINLSADPDISIIRPWYDLRILSGIIIILMMIFIMLKTSLKKELRPISFGIAWFFIALLPTTLNPLFQIANDHRMFLPFIGLFIAVPWSIKTLFRKFYSNKKNRIYNTSITIIAIMILTAHGYGTTQRNKTWNSKESLWLDVTKKSPKNARGLMNYGLSQMEKGNYDIALKYFNHAYTLEPNYSSIHINLGIIYGAQKNHAKALQYFKSALTFNTTSPDPEYYYARYLYNQKKYAIATPLLNKALQKSPNHSLSIKLLDSISKKTRYLNEEIKSLTLKIKENHNPEDYIQLSLKHYEKGAYKLVISTCEELLKIDPNNAAAYNNICSAYNQMKQWKLGASACQKALKINPNYQLAKNNLKWSNNNIKQPTKL